MKLKSRLALSIALVGRQLNEIIHEMMVIYVKVRVFVHNTSAHFQYSQYICSIYCQYKVNCNNVLSATFPAAEKPLNLQTKSNYYIFIKFTTPKWVLASPSKSALIGWFDQIFLSNQTILSEFYFAITEI